MPKNGISLKYFPLSLDLLKWSIHFADFQRNNGQVVIENR